MTENKYQEKANISDIGIIALESIAELGSKVNDYIVSWREKEQYYATNKNPSFMIRHTTARFGTGEGKCILHESVRGKDLYILVDICNYSITYPLYGYENHMTPDEHYQDLKRIILAVSGKARRITVIMPYLYEGRQHRKNSRESLDCAYALHELTQMGVDNILTFDTHDPRVQNAIPLKGFETIKPTYQFVKALINNVTNIKIDSNNLMVISPDEGGMDRCIYFSTVLGIDLGMFYKRRDYTKIVHGRNPIIAHEFLGTDINGKDVLIIDDMISSGESTLDIARELKKRNAGKIFVLASFGLFTNGMNLFDEAYNEGIIYRVLTTNLVYQNAELLSKPYYISVDMSKYIALLIDSLNQDSSISDILSPTDRIRNFLNKFNKH